MGNLTLLVAVHGVEDTKGFLGCVSVQGAKRVRDPMSVLHCDVTRHVLKGSAGPPVICPLAVKKATKQFVGRKLPAGCNKATGPLVQGPLEFGEDPLAGGVGGESCHKVSVINKTEAHWVQLPFGDC